MIGSSYPRVRINGSHFAICEASVQFCEAKLLGKRENAKQKFENILHKHYNEHEYERAERAVLLLICLSAVYIVLRSFIGFCFVVRLQSYDPNLCCNQTRLILRAAKYYKPDVYFTPKSKMLQFVKMPVIGARLIIALFFVTWLVLRL